MAGVAGRDGASLPQMLAVGTAVFAVVVAGVGLFAGFRVWRSGLLYYDGGGWRFWRWEDLVSWEAESSRPDSGVILTFRQRDGTRSIVIPNAFRVPTAQVLEWLRDAASRSRRAAGPA
jgi:hypothetical protein